MSCRRSQEFLARTGVSVRHHADADQERLGPEEALRLARQAARIVVARGRRVTTFDMKASPPDDRTLLRALLGPTGRLRAPVLRLGDTLLVGFNQQAYEDELG